jgi:hypothetical protein
MSECKTSVSVFFNMLDIDGRAEVAKYFLDNIYSSHEEGKKWVWSLDRDIDVDIVENEMMDPMLGYFLSEWNEIVYSEKKKGWTSRLRIQKHGDTLYKLSICKGCNVVSRHILGDGCDLIKVLREFGYFGYGPLGKQKQCA